MSRPTLLLDWVQRIEEVINCAGLGMKLLDRIGPLDQCTPDELLHKGYTVQATSSTNTNQSRNQDHARIAETFVVQFMYEVRVLGTSSKSRRDEALLLEEQLRTAITGPAIDLHQRLRITTAQRGLHPRDLSWWLSTQTFTAERPAPLGG